MAVLMSGLSVMQLQDGRGRFAVFAVHRLGGGALRQCRYCLLLLEVNVSIVTPSALQVDS